jgi:hypothetical protein
LPSETKSSLLLIKLDELKKDQDRLKNRYYALESHSLISNDPKEKYKIHLAMESLKGEIMALQKEREELIKILDSVSKEDDLKQLVKYDEYQDL